MLGGAGGFLVGSVEECAGKILRLLQYPREGEELVRERFFLPRIIADELVLYSSLLETSAP